MIKVNDRIKVLDDVVMLDVNFNPIVVARAGDLGTVTQITTGSSAEQHGYPFEAEFESGKVIFQTGDKYPSNYEVIEDGR